jgi:hypothetical protein
MAPNSTARAGVASARSIVDALITALGDSPSDCP